MNVKVADPVQELLARSNRLGARPAEHELRGRQHLGEGPRRRPA